MDNSLVGAYKSYIEQAKEAKMQGEKNKCKELFLKAAEITNKIAQDASNISVQKEYYNLTQKLIQAAKDCVQEVCSKEIDSDKNVKEEKQQVVSKVAPKVSLEEALKELNDLIGMEKVKREVNEWVNYIKNNDKRRKQGLSCANISYHLAITGNPGTGKTTVARIMAKIFNALGVIRENKFIEVERSNLVGEYIGHTEKRVKEYLDQAMGGVLFIDEAYQLAGKGEKDFGQVAVDSLIKTIEDNRTEFVFIAAGYTKEMRDFIQLNSGLKSRITKFIEIDDYTPDELILIFKKMCKKNDYFIKDAAEEYLYEQFKIKYEHRTREFANARYARNIYEAATTLHGARLGDGDYSNEEQCELTLEDLQRAYIKEEDNII